VKWSKYLQNQVSCCIHIFPLFVVSRVQFLQPLPSFSYIYSPQSDARPVMQNQTPQKRVRMLRSLSGSTFKRLDPQRLALLREAHPHLLITRPPSKATFTLIFGQWLCAITHHIVVNFLPTVISLHSHLKPGASAIQMHSYFLLYHIASRDAWQDSRTSRKLLRKRVRRPRSHGKNTCPFDVHRLVALFLGR
jgi:hypothetical protein